LEPNLRSNLDPFNQYSDSELWLSLERTRLKKYVEELSLKMETKVVENGNNFSVGQKQLFCLSRALLRNCRVLILDEATASVDHETDSILQETIRNEFKDITVITIAHRLYTIIDSDRIIVMENGNIAEFDHPYKLLENKDGIFYDLVQKTGPSSSMHLMKVAFEKQN